MGNKNDWIVVKWEVYDGYAGGSAPQTTEVDLEDFRHSSKQEIEDLLNEIVHEDFLQKVGFSITSESVIEIQERLKEGE